MKDRVKNAEHRAVSEITMIPMQARDIDEMIEAAERPTIPAPPLTCKQEVTLYRANRAATTNRAATANQAQEEADHVRHQER
jgi:hypothetical protein